VIEAIRHILGRLDAMFRRGKIVAVDDSGDCLRVQVEAWGLSRWMEAVLPYGLSFRPKVGSEVVFSAVGGRTGHQVTFQIGDRRYRLTGMADGEVAINDDQNADGAVHKVHLKRDGILIETTRPDGITLKATGPIALDTRDGRLGAGADAALVREPEMRTFLATLLSVLSSGGQADASTHKVTFTGLPSAPPAAGTTTIKAK